MENNCNVTGLNANCIFAALLMHSGFERKTLWHLINKHKSFRVQAQDNPLKTVTAPGLSALTTRLRHKISCLQKGSTQNYHWFSFCIWHVSFIYNSSWRCWYCLVFHVWIQSRVKKGFLDPVSIYWVVEIHITAALSRQQLVHYHPSA